MKDHQERGPCETFIVEDLAARIGQCRYRTLAELAGEIETLENHAGRIHNMLARLARRGKRGQCGDVCDDDCALGGEKKLGPMGGPAKGIVQFDLFAWSARLHAEFIILRLNPAGPELYRFARREQSKESTKTGTKYRYTI